MLLYFVTEAFLKIKCDWGSTWYLTTSSCPFYEVYQDSYYTVTASLSYIYLNQKNAQNTKETREMLLPTTSKEEMNTVFILYQQLYTIREVKNEM